MKVIIITGSVGTGNTTLSKGLAKKLGYEYIDVNKLVSKEKLSCGYDSKRRCKIIDVKKMNKVLVKIINNFGKPMIKKTNKKIINNKNNLNKKIKKVKGVVIDSHLSHYVPKGHVDVCVVTKCDLKELSKRLNKRGYGKGKVRENLDCEIFDVCFNEAKEKGHKVIVIDTTKGINMGKFSAL